MKRTCFTLLTLWLTSFAAFAQLTPKTLLIYYGYPSSINSTYTVPGAAAVFGQYRYVVLGDGLEFTSHPDYANTKQIMDDPSTSNTLFFGYIDLGVTTQNLPIGEIQNRINLWKEAGANGIFFDDYGYDYQVSRQRQNDAVAYAHAQGLPVVANGWVPADVFGRTVHPTYNPTGAATLLNGSDFYLSESYLITVGNYEDPANWRTKAEALKNYQATIPFKILSITTNASANVYDQAKFWYAWHGAFLYGHEATGWGEANFSATTAQAPFRTRPTIATPGTRFVTNVEVAGNEVFRYTNTGKVWINTSSHTYGFTSCTTCTSQNSGAWTNGVAWSCGRAPFPCDQVVVQSPHTMTVSTVVDAATVSLNGKILYTNGGRLRLWP